MIRKLPGWLKGVSGVHQQPIEPSLLPPPDQKEVAIMPIPEEVLPLDDITKRERDIVQAAALAHDGWLRERAELRQMLDKANLGLEARNNRILQLEADLEVERNRVQSYQAARDEAVDRRIHAEARLADIKVICDREELPAPKPRAKRGKRPTGGDFFDSNGEAVPNGTASQPEVAQSPSVVAYERPVLDQSAS
jgi:hypothetical protein